MGKRVYMIIIFIVTIIAYFVYLSKVGTIYAINYAKVLGSRDITQVDSYFDDDTLIICNGNQGEYKELRPNVKNILEGNLLKIETDSSYGYTNKYHFTGIQNVIMQSYISGKEIPIELELRQRGLFNFSVKSIKSDHELFSYLYFGVKQ